MHNRTDLAPARLTHLARRATALALIVILQLQGLAHAADLSQQMANMFGSGTLSNVTGPGAYRSQAQNIYAAGELQLRFPTRNYQLWSYTLPHISAGCGGVDLYLGSFSHISEEQFKEMLQAVARSYSGMLFKVALKSINPLIESTINDLQKTLEGQGWRNGNSCDLAKTLTAQTLQATGDSCETAAMKTYDEDLAAAKRRCRTDQVGTNNDAKRSADPAVQELVQKDMNLVWEAMRNSPFSTEEKTVFLNIAGTIVIFKPANNGNVPKSPVEHGPGIDSLSDLLFGNEPGTSADRVKLNNWLTCNDADCLAPTRGSVEITPFTTHVRQMLEGIRDNVMTRTALTADQIRFINMTRVPVYRMFSASYTSASGARDSELADVLIAQYSKVIAFDYAYAFMRKALKDVRNYAGMIRVKTAPEERQAARMVANVERILEEVDREHVKALGQVRDANAVVEHLERIERQLRQSLPGSIRGMLGMTSLMRGAGSGEGG